MTREQQIEFYEEKKREFRMVATSIINRVCDGEEVVGQASRGLFALAVGLECIEDLLDIPEEERTIVNGKIIAKV